MPYRLYLDESGTDDVTHCDQEEHRFLGLTGVIIKQDHSRDFCVPDLARIKREIFDHDPDHPPCLHREDIMGFKREFHVLRNDAVRARFDDAILRYMDAAQYVVISVVIDKQAMIGKANWVYKEPYHYLMDIITEKFALFLRRKNDTGDIMPEMRRGLKDKNLQRAYLRTWISGTYHAPRSLIQARLPAKQLKFRSKEHNIAGLQLSDLIAHPSTLYVRQSKGHRVNLGPFALRIIDLLNRKKYDRSNWGTITGYGMKYLP